MTKSGHSVRRFVSALLSYVVTELSVAVYVGL
jgi:hypothetical protein